MRPCSEGDSATTSIGVERPRLQLKPRTLPVAETATPETATPETSAVEVVAAADVAVAGPKAPKANPFGGAR